MKSEILYLSPLLRRGRHCLFPSVLPRSGITELVDQFNSNSAKGETFKKILCSYKFGKSKHIQETVILRLTKEKGKQRKLYLIK